MRNNVLDLIVYLAKRIRLGDKLNDITSDSLSSYNPAEISAAYSWILQKHPGYATNKASKVDIRNHRVLHYAERMLISREAYGYLLEMVNIGLMDYKTMEHIIEKVMFHATEPIDLERVKALTEAHLFDNDNLFRNHTSHLRGNESIN